MTPSPSSRTTASIIGSFRKYYDDVLDAISIFHNAGIGIASPEGSEVVDPTDEFVRFVTDPRESTDADIQAQALRRILSSDFVYTVCPSGYLGRTTCYEIGMIQSTGIPLYFSSPPKDLPIALRPGSVVNAKKLTQSITSRRDALSLKGGIRPLEDASPAHRLASRSEGRCISVLCGSGRSNDPQHIRVATEFGEWCARNGWTVLLGGAPTGLMSAVARAVTSHGGTAIGIVPPVYERLEGVEHALSVVCRVDSASRRLDIFRSWASATVALPGGFGTLAEIIGGGWDRELQGSQLAFLSLSGYWDAAIEQFATISHHSLGGSIRAVRLDSINGLTRWLQSVPMRRTPSLDAASDITGLIE